MTVKTLLRLLRSIPETEQDNVLVLLNTRHNPDDAQDVNSISVAGSFLYLCEEVDSAQKWIDTTLETDEMLADEVRNDSELMRVLYPE